MANTTLQHSIPMGKIAKSITLEVKITGRRRFAARLWLSIRLIRLAAFISGMNVEVDTSGVQSVPQPPVH